MSSLLILQNKNEVIMTSDTASSKKIEGKTYRVSDNEKKIFDINGYKVFASGEKHIRDLFLTIVDESVFSPEYAESILSKYFVNFDKFCLEVTIAEKKKRHTVVYFLSSYENFRIIKNVSFDDSPCLFAAGIKTKEISDEFEGLFRESGNINESLYRAYAAIQSEEVGGSIETHKLSDGSVVERKLPDIEMNRIDSYSHTSLIIGDRIIGKLLMGTQLIIEDENGIIRIQGSLQEIFDPEGNVKVALGEYEVGKYGIKIDSGALEIVGGIDSSHINPALYDEFSYDDTQLRNDLRLTAPLPSNLLLNSNGITASQTTNASNFARLDYRGLYVQGGAIDIRTGSATNRGVIFDGNGIRGYNSLGTKTFEIDTNGRLTASSGTFSGNLSGAGGTFSGTLSGVDGTFKGSLSSGVSITSPVISGGSITGTTISSDSSISVTTDAYVGDNLYLGNGTDKLNTKSIFFNYPYGMASIAFKNDSINLEATNGTFIKNYLMFSNGTSVDFTGATVTGLTVSYATSAGNATTLNGYSSSAFSLSGHAHGNTFVKTDFNQNIQMYQDTSTGRIVVKVGGVNQGTLAWH